MNNTEHLRFFNLKELPNNFLAEQGILNILLLNPNLLKETSTKVKTSFFYSPNHQLIYSLLLEFEKNNYTLSLTTLLTIIYERNLMEKIGGLRTIDNIINSYQTPIDLNFYIDIIKEKYLKRLLIEIGKQIIDKSYLNNQKSENIFELAETQLNKITQELSSTNAVSIGEIMPNIFLELQRRIKTNELSGFQTSFYDLDAIIQGCQPSDLIIIAGRPSMGKTAFALNIGKNIMHKYNVPLIIFSLEMSKQQLIYRLLASESNINSNRLKTGKMTQNEWFDLSTGMDKLSRLPIYIDDSAEISVTEIRLKLKKILTNQKKKAIVIIDYLQLMKENKSENRVQEIALITRNLKILAKEFDIPILLLSQLSRNLELRQNKRPILSDLRESGAIEQDADLVMMLYREEYYQQKKSNGLQITECIITKNRNGSVGTLFLDFNPFTTTFINAKNQT